MTPKTRRGIN